MEWHFHLQISDFNHRRMNRPSSTEENEIKEATEKKAPEEELEVQDAHSILRDYGNLCRLRWSSLVSESEIPVFLTCVISCQELSLHGAFQ